MTSKVLIVSMRHRCSQGSSMQLAGLRVSPGPRLRESGAPRIAPCGLGPHHVSGRQVRRSRQAGRSATSGRVVGQARTQ